MNPVALTPAPPPTTKPNRAFIIIGIVLIVALIGYGIWLYISYRNKTGFFRPFTPTLSNGLTTPVPAAQANQPLTPEVKAKRDAMIQRALDKLQNLRALNAFRSTA